MTLLLSAIADSGMATSCYPEPLSVELSHTKAVFVAEMRKYKNGVCEMVVQEAFKGTKRGNHLRVYTFGEDIGPGVGRKYLVFASGPPPAMHRNNKELWVTVCTRSSELGQWPETQETLDSLRAMQRRGEEF